jgi:pimeloyl-ACP methyl ester carboxylesterase
VGAALVGGYFLARKIAYAPPDPELEERADWAARSGPWKHGYKAINGLRLHYAEIGSGPLVVLLHGFPECWYEWHNVMPRLGARFRVVAPDLRGYNWSDKPTGVEAYNVSRVSTDIAGLLETFGERQAYIVGHDWGGVVAWDLATRYPGLVKKLVVINAPHPGPFARDLRTLPQFMSSLYALFFQIPLLPEVVMRLRLRSTLRGSAFVPGAFSNEALDVYENGISRPGAVTAMLNYYRASMRDGLRQLSRTYPVVKQPTLVIWGMRDFALRSHLLEGLEEWVPNLHLERVDDSGHWVPEERPRLVTDLLVDFLSREE